MREALIVSTARTPIGKAYRGAFNDTTSPTMGGHAIKHAVERAGGSISTVFYSRLTLRALLKPHRFEAAPVGHRHGGMRPRPALPPPKLMRDVYLTERYRGYLRQLKPGDGGRPHEHPEHADRSLRAKPRYPGWAAADEQARKEGAPLIDDDGSVIAGSSEDPRP